MEPREVENVNFRYHHHKLRCKSTDQDPFVQACYKRKALAQCFYAAHSLCDADGICQVIENKLLPYFTVVDERTDKSINNYADAALMSAAGAGNDDTTKWRSNLRNSRPVLDVVKKLSDCPGQCISLKVAEQDLKLLGNPSVKDNSIKTQIKESFAPNTAVRSLQSGFVPRERPFKETPSDPFRQNQNVDEPLTRGNSFDSAFAKKESNSGIRSSIWQPQRNNTPSTGIEWATCNDSDELRLADKSGFGRKSPSHSNFYTCHTNTFYTRGPAGPSVTTRNIGDEPSFNYNHPGTRVSGGMGGLQVGRNLVRGANHSNQGSEWNRNSTSSGPSNQSNQAEVGMSSVSASIFKSARDELVIQNQKKYGGRGGGGNTGYSMSRGGASVQKRSLGPRRAGVHGQFVPPIKPTDEDDFGGMFGVKQPEMEGGMGEETDERLKNIDPKMVETIRNEIMDVGAPVEWDDIAGLEFAKTTIQEIVVWPLLRPDIFTGLRKPPKGILLFGPPGTGKTLIGKCIASQSQSTFFSISASSLTSKWIGDGEKMVRALFAVAKVHQPAVVFIDEIDSLLTQRSDTEHESSRRIKTEFLVQLDGAGTGDEERILIVGATNRPQELDEAARRRLVKRLYIPLPEFTARRQIVERLMMKERNALSDEDIAGIASLTDGYSGADMKNLCQEASLGPIRSISFSAMHQISADQVRPITVEDFKSALHRVRASVSNKDLEAYVQWDKTYGMGSGM